MEELLGEIRAEVRRKLEDTNGSSVESSGITILRSLEKQLQLGFQAATTLRGETRGGFALLGY
jgi:hypothetical protein